MKKSPVDSALQFSAKSISQRPPASMGVKQVYSFFVTRHSISEFKVSRLAVGVDFFFKVFFNVLRFISVKV